MKIMKINKTTVELIQKAMEAKARPIQMTAGVMDTIGLVKAATEEHILSVTQQQAATNFSLSLAQFSAIVLPVLGTAFKEAAKKVALPIVLVSLTNNVSQIIAQLELGKPVESKLLYGAASDIAGLVGLGLFSAAAVAGSPLLVGAAVGVAGLSTVLTCISVLSDMRGDEVSLELQKTLSGFWDAFESNTLFDLIPDLIYTLHATEQYELAANDYGNNLEANRASNTIYLIHDRGGKDTISIKDTLGASVYDIKSLHDLTFSKIGEHLVIKIEPTGIVNNDFFNDNNEGTIVIHNQGDATKRIETLKIFGDNGVQIGQDISLVSIWGALTAAGFSSDNVSYRLDVSNQQGVFGQKVSLNGFVGPESGEAKKLFSAPFNMSETNNQLGLAGIKYDGSVVSWGDGNKLNQSFSKVAKLLDGSIDVKQVYSSAGAFAALRADGSVVTWGDPMGGGDSSNVASALSGQIQTKKIFSNKADYSLYSTAFAALREDGSVIVWGNPESGGVLASVYTEEGKTKFKPLQNNLLNGDIDVLDIVGNKGAFAALKADGSVVTWGDSMSGGDLSYYTDVTWEGVNYVSVAELLNGSVKVSQIFAVGETFAALREDGLFVVWGDAKWLAERGGYVTEKEASNYANIIYGTKDFLIKNIVFAPDGYLLIGGQNQIISFSRQFNYFYDEYKNTVSSGKEIVDVFLGGYSYGVLHQDGTVFLRGSFSGDVSGEGGKPSKDLMDAKVNLGITKVIVSDGAVAAICKDGSVVTWGDTRFGANQGQMASYLDGRVDVVKIIPLGDADTGFCALREDGSVVIWGSTSPKFISAQENKFIDVYATDRAYYGLTAAGKVVKFNSSWHSAPSENDKFFSVSDANTDVNFSGDFTQGTPVTPSSTKDAQFIVLQPNSPSIVGAGLGDDTYLLSGSMLTAGKDFTISDTSGVNSIQLAPGLSILNSQVSNNALKINLSTGAAVTVLGADRFTYDVGGNSSAGLDYGDVSFLNFVGNTLKATVPSSGVINAGGVVVNSISSASPVVTSSVGADYLVLQYSSPSIVGAGSGDDVYLISPSMLPSGVDLTISDTSGNNSIQLAAGLTIASSQIAATALKLTLTTGATVTILGSNEFTYDVGGNTTTGIDLVDVNYTSFVQKLGASVPNSGMAVGGAVTIKDSSHLLYNNTPEVLNPYGLASMWGGDGSESLELIEVINVGSIQL